MYFKISSIECQTVSIDARRGCAKTALFDKHGFLGKTKESKHHSNVDPCTPKHIFTFHQDVELQHIYWSVASDFQHHLIGKSYEYFILNIT